MFCADGREVVHVHPVSVTLTGSVAVQMVGLPGFDNMPVWGFAGVTVRARGTTIILFLNGVRTCRLPAVIKHTHHLTTGGALAALTMAGTKPPKGVNGTTVVTP